MSKRRRREPVQATPPPPTLPRERRPRSPVETPAWNWWSAPTAFAFFAGMVVMYFALALLTDAAGFAVYVVGLFFFFLFGSHIAMRLFLSRRR